MKRALFILGLATAAAATAAVGDKINTTGKVTYHVEGVIVTSYGTGYGQYCTVRQEESTRLYDSNKGGPWTRPYSDGTEGDSLMCWSHVATNSIQYWQDVYGVFYRDTGNMQITAMESPRALPNGYYQNPAGEEEANRHQKLNIAKQFYYNWNNAAGTFKNAVDWYFKWDSATNPSGPGGYYSEYFGNGASTRDAFISIYSEAMESEYGPATSPGYTPIKDGDTDSLKEALLPGFGLTKQADGTYIQTEEGLMPGISIHEMNKGTGHVLSCQGFTTDTNGKLVSLLLADGDDETTRLQEAYVIEKDGYLKLYKDKEGTKPLYTGKDYYIYEVTYINTPEVLKNMLTEYRSPDEAAIWNGGATTWSTQVDVVDNEIADSATGWDILVNGDNIAEKHHGYYHGYALKGRAVEFGEHASPENRIITINGTIKTAHITVSAAGYEFKAGENAAIAGTGENGKASLSLLSGASLNSALALNLNNLSLESGAVLISSSEVNISGEFIVSLKEMQEAVTYNLRAATLGANADTGQAYINAALNLRAATSVVLETSVDMQGNTLTFADKQAITLAFSRTGEELLLFDNISTLTIGEVTYSATESTSTPIDVSGLLALQYEDHRQITDYTLTFRKGGLWLSAPEPTTTTLSLLALAALAARRRRL